MSAARGPMRNNRFEKPKDFKGTFKRLINYFGKSKSLLLLAVFLTICSTVFSIAGPALQGLVTTEIYEGITSQNSIDLSYITKILLILLLLYGLSSLFKYLEQFIIVSTSQHVMQSLRKSVNEKLFKLPLSYFDTRTHGEILSTITNDIDTISHSLQQSINQVITTVITLIGTLCMMIYISPILTLMTLAIVPLSLFVSAKIVKLTQPLFKERQKALAQLNGFVEEHLSGHMIIKAFSKEEESIKLYSKYNQNLYNYNLKSTFYSFVMMPILGFFGNIGYVGVCAVGGFLALSGKLLVGEIQAFVMYIRQFNQPIVQLANIASILQSTAAAAERVFILLDEAEEPVIEDFINLNKNIKGNVAFKNVNFGYTKEKTVIRNLSLEVKAGTTVAIVGETGAGKTTLINLLMRFYDVDSGSIYIDDMDISKLQRRDLRSLFGMVLQDTWLFSGTVADNISYGNRSGSRDEVIAAAKAANAHHFISSLPNGYDMVLNEDENSLSLGERQLLTIARAMMCNPKIMILDEATSSVDTRTELLIQRGMHRLMNGRTNFIIAHRLSTIRDADLILVMADGEIAERGTHEELMQYENGLYRELYENQFK